MTYIEAVGYTMLGATVAVCVTLYLDRHVTRVFDWCRNLISGRRSDQSAAFNPNLRKALRFYRRYGFWGLMILTPVLIGLPLGVWIAVRMGSSKNKIAVATLSIAFVWSTASFLATLHSLDQLLF